MIEKINKIIIEKAGLSNEAVIDPEKTFNELGFDSLDTVELIMEFEKQFDLSIPDSEAANLSTVQSVYDYIEGKTK